MSVLSPPGLRMPAALGLAVDTSQSCPQKPLILKEPILRIDTFSPQSRACTVCYAIFSIGSFHYDSGDFVIADAIPCSPFLLEAG